MEAYIGKPVRLITPAHSMRVCGYRGTLERTQTGFKVGEHEFTEAQIFTWVKFWESDTEQTIQITLRRS